MVTGSMHRQPWEKDQAKGELTGSKEADGELNLVYDYMIEGMKQTETVVMKIEGGNLLIKQGEMVDLKNDGNLMYQDVAAATYSQSLPSVPCGNK